MLRLTAPTVMTGSEELPGATVVVDEGTGRIAEVGSPSTAPGATALAEGMLVPGFVDVQVNGGAGVDLMTADLDGWRHHARWLVSTGVTAYCPTLVSARIETLADRAGLARDLVGEDDPRAARNLGLHCEGPFLAPDRVGAHSPEHLVTPTPGRVTALLEATRGVLRVVTLAPELPGALEAVRRLAAAGVTVSVGHSAATAGQVAAAAAAGATSVTHVFNAQSGIHHREPGVAAQALADRRLVVGLIADHEHVDPTVCSVVLAAAAGRVALVTDAVAAAGMAPGRYLLGGQATLTEEGHAPRLADGTLAGSGLTMPTALRNAVADGYDVRTAVEAATRVPADLVGRGDLGRIAPGAAADLLWLGADLSVRAVWRAGRRVHETPGTRVGGRC